MTPREELHQKIRLLNAQMGDHLKVFLGGPPQPSDLGTSITRIHEQLVAIN